MSNTPGLWGQETKHFHQLSPDEVMKAAEEIQFRLSGRIMALNSLENRVYDIELARPQDFGPSLSTVNVIAKFYRPGRWDQDQILEEHRFLNELKDFEVPVIAPLEIQNKTLHHHKEMNLYYAFFPKVQGRLKDELIKDEIDQAGRLIGRIHNIGSMARFNHRLNFSVQNFISSSLKILEELTPVDYPSFQNYLLLVKQTESLITPFLSSITIQKIHGDFHRGNIVWTSSGPFAVDFDDSLNGPVEQDLWLLFPGQDEDSLKDRERFLSAYREMTRKDHLSMNFTEIFRTMRMIHFNAWIAKRWQDHSFQRTFPQFISPSYWDQQLIDLRIQLGMIQDRFGMGLE